MKKVVFPKGFKRSNLEGSEGPRFQQGSWGCLKASSISPSFTSQLVRQTMLKYLSCRFGQSWWRLPLYKKVHCPFSVKMHISQTHRSKVGQTTFVNEQVDVVLMLKQVEFMYWLMFRCFLEQLSAFVCCMFQLTRRLNPPISAGAWQLPCAHPMFAKFGAHGYPCQIARSGPSFCRAWGKTMAPHRAQEIDRAGTLQCELFEERVPGWIVVPNRNQQTSLRQSPKWPVKVEAASSCRRLASSLGSKCS